MAVTPAKKFPSKDNRNKPTATASSIKAKSGLPAATAYGLLIAATAVVFSNSINANFLAFDDFDYVVNNPYIKSLSWVSIVKIFSVFHYANYHPLTTLSYAIEHTLFGHFAPAYHAINLLIHIVNVCLVYVLLQKLGLKQMIAFAGALFFGIHPMHVESVSWISERKDVLYSAFYIGGLISYINYLSKEKQAGVRPFPYSTFILFFLSLLSKPAANTFPLLLVLLDFYFSKRSPSDKRKLNARAWLEKIPFFLLAVAFGIVTVLAQHAGGALTDVTRPHYTIMERFFVVSYALVFYIVRFFLPVDLCALHYAPKELPIYFYLSPILIAGILWLVFSPRFKALKEPLVFGLLFYLCTLILVIQIIPIGYVNVSERYSYVPYIGLIFIAGSFYEYVKDKNKKRMKYFVYAVAIAFAIISFQRNKVWHDTLSLFTDNSEKNLHSSQAQFVLGEKQYEIGDMKSALESYSRSIELDSTVAPVYFWRGNAYGRLQSYVAAIADYQKAAQLKPGYLEAYNNIGTIYMKQNDYGNAIIYFTKCIAIKPSEYLYLNRATSYFYLKQYTEAIEDYTKGLAINPNLADAYFNRGVCYLYLEQKEKACPDWKRAAEMNYEKAGELLKKFCL